jgi:hypothetical protein
MKIAIIGSSAQPPGWYPPTSHIAAIANRIINDIEASGRTVEAVYVRSTKLLSVDSVVRFLFDNVLEGGYPCYALAPLGNRREDVYLRDIALVDAVDEVYAFFAPGKENTGGTQHVIEKALDAKKKVEVYTFDRDNGLVYLGSDS